MIKEINYMTNILSLFFTVALYSIGNLNVSSNKVRKEIIFILFL